MKVRWSPKALADIERLHTFLAAIDPDAASRARDLMRAAPQRLVDLPRGGQRVESISGGEVRRIPVGIYEMRYELFNGEIYILRVHHQRESRAR